MDDPFLSTPVTVMSQFFTLTVCPTFGTAVAFGFGVEATAVGPLPAAPAGAMFAALVLAVAVAFVVLPPADDAILAITIRPMMPATVISRILPMPPFFFGGSCGA